MGRSKIPITWIKSDASRQVTFNKRKKGMKKKAEELAILCGVDVCMICYGPAITGGSSSSSSVSPNSSLQVIPFSWGMPSVASVISKFEGLPKEERDKKKLDNTSLLEQQIKKLRRELKTKLDQNWKLEQERSYFAWDHRLDSFNVEELKRLADCLLDKLRITFERVSCWEQQQQQQELANIPPMDEFTPQKMSGETAGFISFVNPFVLPSQQAGGSINPSLQVFSTQFMEPEGLGIAGPSGAHQINMWNSPSQAVVTSTYPCTAGGVEEWQQEAGAPLLHSMLFPGIGESEVTSDESKAEQNGATGNTDEYN